MDPMGTIEHGAGCPAVLFFLVLVYSSRIHFHPETSKLTLGRLVATTGTWYSSALVTWNFKKDGGKSVEDGSFIHFIQSIR